MIGLPSHRTRLLWFCLAVYSGWSWLTSQDGMFGAGVSGVFAVVFAVLLVADVLVANTFGDREDG